MGEFCFMDTHGSAVVVEGDHGHAVPESGERFEKAELEYFVDSDRETGKNIGKLLALVFLISFVLMIGVCTWMYTHNNHSHDPQAGVGEDTSATAEHH
jgi:hypothetical protein